MAGKAAMTDRAFLLKWVGSKVRGILAKARERHPETLEDGLSPEEVLELLGPAWSSMDTRQRLLYGVPGGLTDAEKDALWGEGVDEKADAA